MAAFGRLKPRLLFSFFLSFFQLIVFCWGGGGFDKMSLPTSLKVPKVKSFLSNSPKPKIYNYVKQRKAVILLILRHGFYVCLFPDFFSQSLFRIYLKIKPVLLLDLYFSWKDYFCNQQELFLLSKYLCSTNWMTCLLLLLFM